MILDGQFANERFTQECDEDVTSQMRYLSDEPEEDDEELEEEEDGDEEELDAL